MAKSYKSENCLKEDCFDDCNKKEEPELSMTVVPTSYLIARTDKSDLSSPISALVVSITLDTGLISLKDSSGDTVLIRNGLWKAVEWAGDIMLSGSMPEGSMICVRDKIDTVVTLAHEESEGVRVEGKEDGVFLVIDEETWKTLWSKVDEMQCLFDTLWGENA